MKKGVKSMVFGDMEPKFQNYGLFRIAIIGARLDATGEITYLYFIGAGNRWYLNPFQKLGMILTSANQKLEQKKEYAEMINSYKSN